MSVLIQKDLHTPLTTAGIRKLMGVMQAVKTAQDPAADLTYTTVADHPGTIRSFYIVLEEAFEASETMTVNLTVNGSSVMTGAAAQSLTASTGTDQQVELNVVSGTTLATGDVIAIVRNWTTGGGVDTTPANIIGLEWS